MENKKEIKQNNFIDDIEKIKDMVFLSKNDFLNFYSYLTDEEYENTKNKILQFVESRKKLYKELNANIKEG